MFNFFKKKIFSNRYMDKAHATDAGFDIYTPDAFVVPPRGYAKVNTKLRVVIPKGCVGLVLPRSSMSKIGLHVCTGVIDSGFSGEICLSVNNLTDHYLRFSLLQRIAQLVIIPCVLPKNVIVSAAKVEDLNSKISDRGDGGFGSTGA